MNFALLRLLVGATLLFGSHALAGLPPAAVALLDRPAFSLTAAEMEKLRAEGAPPRLDVEVLFHGMTWQFDEKGRLTHQERRIYRVFTDAGVQRASGLTVSYQPWYQEPPVLEARVLTPDGGFVSLDPKTIARGSSAPQGDAVYRDEQHLSAPIPAVRAGAMVETRISVREHLPYFEAGRVVRFGLGSTEYTALVRLDVRAPADSPVRIERRASTPTPKTSIDAGAVVSRFERSDVRPFDEQGLSLDPDTEVLPMVDVGTGKSWAAVAGAYSTLVDQALVGFDAAPHLAALKGVESPAERVARLTAYTHTKVRYTGLHLGAASIRPTTPTETLARGYGDCKDKSTLLVALLRAAGLTAHVVLLRVGTVFDVAEKVPGLGTFNHAIVQVAGNGVGPLFIDPTDPYAAPGVLPYPDQDRRALIAAPETRALVRTPRDDASANLYEEEIRIEFPDLGRARVREVSRAIGARGAIARRDTDHPVAALTEGTSPYAKARYSASVEKIRVESADAGAPHVVTLDTGPSERFETFVDGGFAPLGPLGLLNHLPDTLLAKPKDELTPEEIQAATRTGPLLVDPPFAPVYLPKTFTKRMRYRLLVPDGFAWRGLPEPARVELAGIRLLYEVKRIGDREVEVLYEGSANARLVPHSQIEDVRKAVAGFARAATNALNFVHVPRAALGEKKYREALVLDRRLVAEHPQSVSLAARQAQHLNEAGFGTAARAAARRLTQAHPASALAWSTLESVLACDGLGRRFFPGADLEGAVAALRKAVELEPDRLWNHGALVELLNFRATRAFPPDTKGLADVTARFAAARTRISGSHGEQFLLQSYALQRAWPEASALAAKMPAGKFRDGAWVAAIAGTQGPEAAGRQAERLADSPVSVLTSALGFLLSAGQFEVASRVMALPALSTEAAASSAIIDAAMRRPICEAALPPAARALDQWLRETMTRPDELLDPEWLMERRRDPAVDASGLRFARNELVKIGGNAGRNLAWPALACRARWQVEEKVGAVQVTLTWPDAAGKDVSQVFYLRHVGRRFDVVAAKRDFELIPYSRGALLAIGEKRLDEARVWLEWGRAVVDSPGFEKWKVQQKNLRALWPAEPSKASVEELSVIAAAMAQGREAESRDVRILEVALTRTGAPERRIALLTVAAQMARPDLKATARHAGALHAAAPDDVEAWRRYIVALHTARDDATAGEELGRFLTTHPTDEPALRFQDRLDARRGRFIEALDRAMARPDTPARREHLNNMAWQALNLKSTGAELDRAIAAAELACKPTESAAPSALHTLATLQAEAGRVDEALSTLQTYLSRDKRRRVDPEVWLPFGLVAERLGFTEVAKDAYDRVPAEGAERPETTAAITRRKLAGLKPVR